MNTIITTEFIKGGEEYLSNLTPVEFSPDENKALTFLSKLDAKSTLSSRFISLSNWVSHNYVRGVFIDTIDNGKIIERVVFL